MQNNPFISNTYSSVWLQHFNEGKECLKPDFIPDLSFVKHTLLPYFYNTGKTHTKGISYNLNLQYPQGLRNKVFLIYDVPAYFSVNGGPAQTNIGLYKVNQYPGFLIELEKFTDMAGFMASFSRNTRTKLNKFRRRLEFCFDIEYKMYYGDIVKETYDSVFEKFRYLLEKRFSDKQTTNNNLASEEWQFYKDVAYPMILEKKAALFVVYDGPEPIGITLNYLSDNTIFDAITVFDIAYTKFHLGTVMLMGLVEWSLKEKLKIFDFSKGYFEYKQRWCTRIYDFEYHIYYDTRSVKARAIALILKTYFRLKQQLRDKKVNQEWHRITYRLRNKATGEAVNSAFEWLSPEVGISKQELVQTTLATEDDQCLKSAVFEFLYLNNECLKDLTIYKLPHARPDYLLCGKNKEILVTVNS